MAWSSVTLSSFGFTLRTWGSSCPSESDLTSTEKEYNRDLIAEETMRQLYQKMHFPGQPDVQNERIMAKYEKEREAMSQEFGVLDRVIAPRDFGF